jgi:hypothetical protein
MRPVETIPVRRAEVIKNNDRVVKFKYDVLALGNITMYSQ